MIQIRIQPGGKWHRRSARDGVTACGMAIGAFTSRDHELDGDLCQECFTKHERDTGEFEKLAKALQKDSDPVLFYDPDEEPTDPNPTDHDLHKDEDRGLT